MARHQTQSAHQSQSAAAASNPTLRSRFDESWVEVSSRPSSSSLSSVGDEAITTGLRVQPTPPIAARRNRRLRRSLPSDTRLGAQSRIQAVSSSQEEYDESDSESDPVMSSSGEGAHSQSSGDQVPQLPSYASRPISYASEDGDVEDAADDDDENATAVGTVGNAVFTPQPSAFSHPPRLSRTNSSSVPTSRSRRPSATHQRHSFSAQHQHSPYNMISPSHQIDHVAALQASLSTLLSYAAVGRGPSKTFAGQQQHQYERSPASNRIQPTSIGLMPESLAFPDARTAETTALSDTDEKSKRNKTNTSKHSRSDSKDRRASKKRRSSSSSNSNSNHNNSSTLAAETINAIEGVSPTLLTWVVGTGMIVLVAAISFSAGYVVGRETGHAEAAEGFGELGADIVKHQLVAAKGSGLGLRRMAAGAAVGVAAA